MDDTDVILQALHLYQAPLVARCSFARDKIPANRGVHGSRTRRASRRTRAVSFTANADNTMFQ